MAVNFPVFRGAVPACRIGSTWRRQIVVWLLPAWLLPVNAVYGEAPRFCDTFCGARDQMQDTYMTPIRQLEGDALFQSAAAMREQVMTSEQRLLNQFWLHDTAANRIQGGRVWSRLLKHSLRQIRAQQTQLDPGDEIADLDSFSTDNRDYQLRVSDDYIRLVIQYSF